MQYPDALEVLRSGERHYSEIEPVGVKSALEVHDDRLSNFPDAVDSDDQ
jgi:hypothetical protein